MPCQNGAAFLNYYSESTTVSTILRRSIRLWNVARRLQPLLVMLALFAAAGWVQNSLQRPFLNQSHNRINARFRAINRMNENGAGLEDFSTNANAAKNAATATATHRRISLIVELRAGLGNQLGQ